MKRLLLTSLALVAVPFAIIAGCSSDGVQDDGGLGQGGSANGGAPAKGGSSGGPAQGGSPAQGGAPTSGGSDASGGAPASGGSSSGGAATSGGAAGSGTAGGGGAAGSATGGAGGNAPKGGSGGGGGVTTGGSGGGTGGGTAGSSGMGGSTSLISYASAIDGFLHLAPCGQNKSPYDCVQPGCNEGAQKVITKEFKFGGDTSKAYDVTMEVYGVMETRKYNNTTRNAGTANNTATNKDFWSVGGTMPASPGSYNSAELHITPPVTGAKANDYYMNARTEDDTHSVWSLRYRATFAVNGGGTITFRSYDNNCVQIKNCGGDCGTEGVANGGPLIVQIPAQASPPPAATFMQPYQTNALQGQWLYLDVTDVKQR